MTTKQPQKTTKLKLSFLDALTLSSLMHQLPHFELEGKKIKSNEYPPKCTVQVINFVTFRYV